MVVLIFIVLVFYEIWCILMLQSYGVLLFWAILNYYDFSPCSIPGFR